MVGNFLCKNWKERIERRFVMTNADRIRNMSDEELACVIEKIKMCGGLIRTETTSAECNGCKDGYCCNVMQWLQSEAEAKLKELRGESNGKGR